MIILLIFRLIEIYSWVLIAAALISWVPAINFSPLGNFIRRLTNPYLSLFRSLPLQFAGLDFTILAALASLWLIEKFLVIVLTAFF